MSRTRHLYKCFPELKDTLATSKILMVGAGGIGCELLKNLVLSGFANIHLLDLDTIDLSNLNRQFLFRKEHIKKSKALVAKETAARFNPEVELHAYHANIKDKEYDVSWFEQFDLVFNALDNLDARRHVNKMCLAANVPLVESGTTGFRGQVQVIVRGKTECYDCNPKEVPKSFPICTIRSTPSQPIHCIVWSKSYLTGALFGEDEDEPSIEQSTESENAAEINELRKESDAMKYIRQEAMEKDNAAEIVFNKVFKQDIERLASVEEMWQSRQAPTPLDYATLSKGFEGSGEELCQLDQRLWTLKQNIQVFSHSLDRLIARMHQLQKNAVQGTIPSILFDKDDEDTLDFVTAASNIRAHIFGIEMKSKFQTKQMAGNIIPAIATTNAIIAGVCVVQAFKILQQKVMSTKTVFLSRRPERVFNNEAVARPNPSCTVCGISQLSLTANVDIMKLKDLVTDVLQDRLGYSEDFSILTKDLVYDPDFDDNLESTLSSLNINHGTFLTIIDDNEHPRVNLQIVIKHSPGPPFVLPDAIIIPRIKQEKRKRISESPIQEPKRIKFDLGSKEIEID